MAQSRRSAAGFAEQLDYRTLLPSTEAISGKIRLARLVELVLHNILEHVCAQRAILVLDKRGELHFKADADVDESGTRLVLDESIEYSDRLCRAIVGYSARRSEPVVLADAVRTASSSTIGTFGSAVRSRCCARRYFTRASCSD